MKKTLLALLIILFCLNLNAQVNYEKAYFIDNNGTKTECFIKNKDKSDNPIDFEYKLSLEDPQVLNADIKQIKEFKIGEILKFERCTVKLDTSNVNLDALSDNRNPEWNEVTVFLKVLIESDASLYEYKNGNRTAYFYKSGDLAIEQLIYKKFIVEGEMMVNNDFQKQLWTNLNFGSKNIDEFLKLKYKRNDLKDFFIDYNNYNKNTVVDLSKKLAKGSLNLKAKAGISSSALSFSNSLMGAEVNFENEINWTFGAEVEYIMPFNRNKWSVFLAPGYNSYNNETEITLHNTGPFSSDDQVQKWNASFTYLDVAMGFRYYMFISDNSKIFISGFFSTYKEMDVDIHNNYSSDLDSEINNSVGYGIGYSFKNKFNVELKQSSSNIFANYIYWNSNFRVTSVVFGYTIFDGKKKR